MEVGTLAETVPSNVYLCQSFAHGSLTGDETLVLKGIQFGLEYTYLFPSQLRHLKHYPENCPSRPLICLPPPPNPTHPGDLICFSLTDIHLKQKSCSHTERSMPALTVSLD